MTFWDNEIWDGLAAFGEWTDEVRRERGFVWLGTCEADPHQPGPPTLVWGRDHQDGLYVAIWPEVPPRLLVWDAITDEEWERRYPHAHVPAHLPADHVASDR